MKTTTPLDYVRRWLLLTAAVFAIGSPFVVFLHFFRGDWFALLAISMGLASFFVLAIRPVSERMQRQAAADQEESPRVETRG